MGARLRIADRLQRTRLLLLIFSMASAALLIGVLIAAARNGRPMGDPAAFLLVLLGCKWVEEFRGRSFHFGWDLLEAAAFLAVGTTAGNPLIILMLVYARLALGALSVTKLRAVILTVAYITSFAGSALLTSQVWSLGSWSIAYVFLASGFPLVPSVMVMLSEALNRLAETTQRERVLRDVMMQLSAAVTADDVRTAAEPAVRRLLDDPAVRVRLADYETAERLTPAQRAELHHMGLHLEVPDVSLLWREDNADTQACLFAAAMSTAGIVLVACKKLTESQRVTVVTFVEHLAIRLEAATLRDMSERRRIDALVREREETFRHIFERNPQPMWIYEAESFRILAVNDAAVNAYGYSREEFLDMSGDALDVEEASGRQHQLKDGRVIDVDVETSTVNFNGQGAVLLVARDVTEQRVLQRRLEHNAMHDALTGLPNNVLLRNRIRRALSEPHRRTEQPMMLVFDLDGFKMINDTLGHATGDRVIAVTGARLAASIKASDTASRLGGDEFAVLLNDSNEENALRVAHRLIAEIRKPMNIEGERVTVNASCGIAAPRPDQRTPEDLLGDADIAMYVAKMNGAGSCVVFDHSFRTAITERLTMRRELNDALEHDAFDVVYQPQLDLGSGRVIAAEALVRWTHPVRGPIPPDVFIPVAEQAGLVSNIDAVVLRSACGELRRWLDQELPPIRIAVNVSGRDLERDDLVEMVRSTLADFQIEPWRLELELTETVAMSQPETAIARLQELRALGVRIAIDDFGTGFSMLSRLRELPIDRLKIDRSFIRALPREDDSRAIVAATVVMAHSLGLDIVAEGVEEEETAGVLRDLGCDGAQGYYFARPLPAAELRSWVLARTSPAEAVPTASPALAKSA